MLLLEMLNLSPDIPQQCYYVTADALTDEKKMTRNTFASLEESSVSAFIRHLLCLIPLTCFLFLPSPNTKWVKVGLVVVPKNNFHSV